jgi:hypothetical protein
LLRLHDAWLHILRLPFSTLRVFSLRGPIALPPAPGIDVPSGRLSSDESHDGSRPHANYHDRSGYRQKHDPWNWRSGRNRSCSYDHGTRRHSGLAVILRPWIGLVPREDSTGGKQKLGPISKQGDRYLRRILVVGAHSVLRRAKQSPEKYLWLTRTGAPIWGMKTAPPVLVFGAHSKSASTPRTILLLKFVVGSDLATGDEKDVVDPISHAEHVTKNVGK